jgi:hypothetical protein
MIMIMKNMPSDEAAWSLCFFLFRLFVRMDRKRLDKNDLYVFRRVTRRVCRRRNLPNDDFGTDASAVRIKSPTAVVNVFKTSTSEMVNDKLLK